MTEVTFPESLGGDGSTVSDDADPDTGLRNGGHRTRFVAALVQIVAICARVVSVCQNAVSAVLGAANMTGTSTTSLTIGTGSKAFTAQTGKAFVPGMPFFLANQADATQQMSGVLTAYDSGTGAASANITQTSGSGTFASWHVGPGAPALVAGWQQVGSDHVVSSPVAAVDLSGLNLLPGAEIYIEIDGLSFATDTQALQLQTSVDGSTFSTAKSISANLASASSYDGAIHIPHAKASKMLAVCSLDLANTGVRIDNTVDSTSGTGTKTFVIHRGETFHTLRLKAATGNIDAGTVRLYQKV